MKRRCTDSLPGDEESEPRDGKRARTDEPAATEGAKPTDVALDPNGMPTAEQREAYLAALTVTDEDVARISSYPQHLENGDANPDWLAARSKRLTGSNFAAAANHNRYSSRRNLVKEMLWRTFKGNAATQYGTDNEPVACSLYERDRRLQREAAGLSADGFRIDHPGLIVWKENPWIGVSPDGIVHEDGDVGLLEIKCPFKKVPYDGVPSYYVDQLQGLMGILGFKWCDFVVYVPDKVYITRVPFDADYFNQELLPALREFYMEHYLHVAIWKELGMLREGEIDLPREKRGSDSVPRSSLPFILGSDPPGRSVPASSLPFLL